MTPTPGVGPLYDTPGYLRSGPAPDADKWPIDPPRPARAVPQSPEFKKALTNIVRLGTVRNQADADLAVAQERLGRTSAEDIEAFAAAMIAGKPEPASTVGRTKELYDLALTRQAAAVTAIGKAKQDAWGLADQQRPGWHAEIVAASEEKFAAATAAHAAYLVAVEELAELRDAAQWCAESAWTNTPLSGRSTPPPAPTPIPPLDPNWVDPDAGEGPITRAARQRQRATMRPEHIQASLSSGYPVKG